MTTSSHQAALEELGGLLEQRGFRYRKATYFSENGIVASKRRDPALPPDKIVVLENAVALYRTTEGWEARVTEHGGPHWVRRADDLEMLEEIAVEALTRRRTPPSDAWINAWD